VVSFFALIGILNLLDGVGYVRRPWTVPHVKYYSGELTVLCGILLLGVAIGLFRFNAYVRIIAIIIAARCVATYGAVAVVMPGVVPAVLSLVWLLVLAWLFYPTVRERFVVGKHDQKMA